MPFLLLLRITHNVSIEKVISVVIFFYDFWKLSFAYIVMPFNKLQTIV